MRFSRLWAALFLLSINGQCPFNSSFQISEIVTAPMFSLNGGQYYDTATLYMQSTSTLGVIPTIFFTSDGSTPTSSSPQFKYPLLFSSVGTYYLRAIAFGFCNFSAVASAPAFTVLPYAGQPVMRRAEIMASNLASIVVTFDRETDSAGQQNASFPCSLILSQESIRLLGPTSTLCLFQTSSRLLIQIAPGATVRVGDKLTLETSPAAVGVRYRLRASLRSNGSVEISPPSESSSFSVRIEGPTMISTCGSFSLKAVHPNVIGFLQPTYTWSINSTAKNIVFLSLLVSAQKSLSTIIIDTSNIEPRVPHTFSVVAKNFLNEISTATFSLSKSDTAIPTVQIFGGPYRETTVDKLLILEGIVRVSDCAGSQLKLATNSNWIQTAGPVLTLNINDTAKSATLNIPSEYLSVGSFTFQFCTQVSYSNIPTTPVCASVIVAVLPRPVSVAISGGSRYAINSSPIIFSTVLSDPDSVAGGWTCSWSCRKIADGVPDTLQKLDYLSALCPDLSGTSNCQIELAGYGVATGAYYVYVTAAKRDYLPSLPSAPSSRSASTFATIFVVTSQPTFQISLSATPTMGLKYGAGEAISVAGVSPLSLDKYSISIEPPASPFPSPAPSLSVSATTSTGDSSGFFNFPVGFFTPGKTYNIKFTAESAAGKSFSDIFLTFISPPFGGGCSVDPTIGEALTQQFQIECSGWLADFSDLPLHYNSSFLADANPADFDIYQTGFSSDVFQSWAAAQVQSRAATPIPLTSMSLSPAVSLRLPSGTESNGNRIILRQCITDAFGSENCIFRFISCTRWGGSDVDVQLAISLLSTATRTQNFSAAAITAFAIGGDLRKAAAPAPLQIATLNALSTLLSFENFNLKIAILLLSSLRNIFSVSLLDDTTQISIMKTAVEFGIYILNRASEILAEKNLGISTGSSVEIFDLDPLAANGVAFFAGVLSFLPKLDYRSYTNGGKGENQSQSGMGKGIDAMQKCFLLKLKLGETNRQIYFTNIDRESDDKIYISSESLPTQNLDNFIFNLPAQSTVNGSANNVQINSAVSVKFPSGIYFKVIEATTTGTVEIFLALFGANTILFRDENLFRKLKIADASPTIVTENSFRQRGPIVSLAIYDGSKKLGVRLTNAPLVLSLPLLSPPIYGRSTDTPTQLIIDACYIWNRTLNSWDRRGCIAGAVTLSNNLISCFCFVTGEFAPIGFSATNAEFFPTKSSVSTFHRTPPDEALILIGFLSLFSLYGIALVAAAILDARDETSIFENPRRFFAANPYNYFAPGISFWDGLVRYMQQRHSMLGWVWLAHPRYIQSRPRKIMPCVAYVSLVCLSCAFYFSRNPLVTVREILLKGLTAASVAIPAPIIIRFCFKYIHRYSAGRFAAASLRGIVLLPDADLPSLVKPDPPLAWADKDLNFSVPKLRDMVGESARKIQRIEDIELVNFPTARSLRSSPTLGREEERSPSTGTGPRRRGEIEKRDNIGVTISSQFPRWVVIPGVADHETDVNATVGLFDTFGSPLDFERKIIPADEGPGEYDIDLAHSVFEKYHAVGDSTTFDQSGKATAIIRSPNIEKSDKLDLRFRVDAHVLIHRHFALPLYIFIFLLFLVCCIWSSKLLVRFESEMRIGWVLACCWAVVIHSFAIEPFIIFSFWSCKYLFWQISLEDINDRKEQWLQFVAHRLVHESASGTRRAVV